MAFNQPNIQTKNNPQTVTGGDMGVVIDGGTAGITLQNGNITTADTITAGTVSTNTLLVGGQPVTSSNGTVTSVSVVTANGVSGSVATATTTPAITLTLGAITPSSVSTAGNLTFSSTAQLITGDMSSATASTGRLAFQSSATDTNSYLHVKPNGAGVSAAVIVENTAGQTNGSYANFFITNTSSGFQSAARGAGTQLPMNFTMGPTGTVIMSITVENNVRLCASAVTTTATDGFPYIPTCPGVPTGTPTSISGFSPLVIDSTNNKMYFYSGGAWNALN